MILNNPTKSDIPSLRLLWQKAFGDDDKFLDSFFETAFMPKNARCIFQNGIPVSVLYILDCAYADIKAAYIYAVATDENFRGQGLCTRLMKDTHDYLKKNGYRAALLVPGSKHLFDFYRKLGYETATGIDIVECQSSEKAVPFRKISIEEYAVLRRQYLPLNAVVQEGKSLEFLSKLYSFYCTDSSVFAASVREDTLYCAEYLGDISLASSVVTALQCQKGLLRTVGNKRPFCMINNLGDALLPLPFHFGFVFD